MPIMTVSTGRALISGGGFRGAYDAFVPSIVHAYEPARRVLSSYTGPLRRLRRASDNAEADFTYTANGDLDVAAIAAWAGGASNDVTVYDQAPAGDDVTQAVAGDQPLYVASIQNGHSGMRLDGVNHYLQGAYTTGGALSQPVSIFAVAALDAVAVDDGRAHVIIDGDDAVTSMVGMQEPQAGADRWAIVAGVTLGAGASNGNWNIWSILFNGAASQFWINTVSQASGNAGVQNPDGITIGANDSTTVFWDGDITSIIVCDPSLSDAQRVAMQNSMNAYWGCF